VIESLVIVKYELPTTQLIVRSLTKHNKHDMHGVFGSTANVVID
jgi:hypothetical protein